MNPSSQRARPNERGGLLRGAGAVVLLVIGVSCSSSKARPDSSTARSSASSAVTPAAPAGSTTAAPPAPSTETAVAPEVNPPGDIPDTQAFVPYASSAGGYVFDIPEGWARTENGANVSFVSKLDGVKVDVTQAAAPPTAATARTTEAKQIQAQGRAVSITSVADITLPAGKAVVIKYTSNSEPNAVTQKQVRLENEAYLYFKNGKLATLTVWAPKGADNVDQWTRMSKSFKWT